MRKEVRCLHPRSFPITSTRNLLHCQAIRLLTRILAVRASSLLVSNVPETFAAVKIVTHLWHEELLPILVTDDWKGSETNHRIFYSKLAARHCEDQWEHHGQLSHHSWGFRGAQESSHGASYTILKVVYVPGQACFSLVHTNFVAKLHACGLLFLLFISFDEIWNIFSGFFLNFFGDQPFFSGLSTWSSGIARVLFLLCHCHQSWQRSGSIHPAEPNTLHDLWVVVFYSMLLKSASPVFIANPIWTISGYFREFSASDSLSQILGIVTTAW